MMQQRRMNVQANNIANVNHYGFKAEKASFSQLMYRDVIGIDEAELPKGTGTRIEKTATDFSSSGYFDTGYLFDYAIVGDGFFALYDPKNGEISFTRDGSFSMSQFFTTPAQPEEPEIDPVTGEAIPSEPEEVWRLSDNYGRFVLDSQGGFIEIDPEHKDATLDVGVFDYAIHDGMRHAEAARFLPTEKNGALYLGTGEAKRGMIELSNVDLAQEFIKVIESQRAYSYALKMCMTSDEIETTINGLRS
jgi:flagellar basal-body rod protein FlgG